MKKRVVALWCHVDPCFEVGAEERVTAGRETVGEGTPESGCGQEVAGMASMRLESGEA